MMYYQVKPFTKQFVTSASKLLAKIQSMPAQHAGCEVIKWEERSSTGKNTPGLFLAWLFHTRFFIPVELFEVEDGGGESLRAEQEGVRSVIRFDVGDADVDDIHYPCVKCIIEGDFIPTAGSTFIEQFDVIAKLYVKYMIHKASVRAKAATHNLELLLEAKDVYEAATQTQLEK